MRSDLKEDTDHEEVPAFPAVSANGRPRVKINLFFLFPGQKIDKFQTSQKDGLTVEVTGGKVRGKTLEGGDIDAWLGIPYAGKPIGQSYIKSKLFFMMGSNLYLFKKKNR